MKLRYAIVPAVVLSAFGSLASAATICPTTGSGPVTCTDSDSSFSVTYDPSAAGLFGGMILSNNTILFLPDAFSANSDNGTVDGPVSETFNMTLTATVAGFDFGSFSLTERGDYLLNGEEAYVSAHGEMRVAYEDTTPPFDTFLGEFDFEMFGTAGGQTNGQWSGTSMIDGSTTSQGGTNQWLGTDGVVGSQVFLTIQNILNATTANLGEQAFIQKKSEMILIEVGNGNPVPVPAAVWLFGSAILSLIGYRKANS